MNTNNTNTLNKKAKTKKIIMALIAVIVAIIVIILGMRNQTENDENITLRIAVNMPMTGDLALYGESVRDGIEMAMDELENSLVQQGIIIKYDMQDNAGNAKNAVTIYKAQALKGFDVYVSGITQQTAAILDDIKKQEKTHFIWSFYPLILQGNDNVFRTWVDYPKEAEYFKKYLDNYKPKAKVACLYLDVVSVQELFNKLFVPSIKDNYEIVFNESFDIGTTDFKNLITKLKQSKPDVIFINGWENHLASIVKESINQDIKKDGNMVFTFDLLDARKYLNATQLHGLVLNIPLYEINSSDLKTEWELRFKRKFKKNPNYSSAYAYDFAMIIYEIAKAFKQSGEKHFDINKYIFNIDQNGITGNLKFSKNGDLIGFYRTCKLDKNGQFILLKK